MQTDKRFHVHGGGGLGGDPFKELNPLEVAMNNNDDIGKGSPFRLDKVSNFDTMMQTERKLGFKADNTNNHLQR